MLTQSKVPFNLSWLLLLLLLSWACAETDLSEVTVPTPFLTIRFQHQTEIVKVEAELSRIGRNLTQVNDSLTSISTRLEVHRDSVSILNALIQSGNTQWIIIRDEILSLMQQDTVISQFFLNQRTQFIAEQTIKNKQRTTLLSGKTKIHRIRYLHADYDQSFTDSLTNFRLPLNINRGVSEYQIFINDTVYQLSLAHQNSFIVDARRNARIRIDSITLINTTFDSVNFNCAPCNASTTATAVHYY